MTESMTTCGDIAIITDSDLDGVSCGIICRAIEFSTDYYLSSPKHMRVDIPKFMDKLEAAPPKLLIITDLSLTDELAERINDFYIKGNPVKYFDHHTSSNNLNSYEWANVADVIGRTKTCATELLWRYLRPDVRCNKYHTAISENDNVSDLISRIDRYVELVRRWDTWDWINLGDDGIVSRNLNTLFRMQNVNSFIETMRDRLLDPASDNLLGFMTSADMDEINLKEAEKTKFIHRKFNDMIHMEENMIIDGASKTYRLGVVFSDEYTSELGNFMCKRDESIDIAVIINMSTGVVNLRTNKDINTSLLAKSLGGGGHMKASGFVINDTSRHNIIREILHLSTGGSMEYVEAE